MDLIILPKKQQETLSISKTVLVNPIALNTIERELQPTDVFDKATMGEVYKGDLGSLGFRTVFTLVSRFLDGFAFVTKLSESQKQILTADLLDDCKYETLEDLILFFKLARKGKYGVAKKGIDGNTIMGDWLPQYLEEKARLREERVQEQKAKNNKILTDQSKTIEFYKEHYKQKAIKQKADEMQQLADESAKDCDKQMLEDLIMTWERDIELRPFVRLLTVKRRKFKNR